MQVAQGARPDLAALVTAVFSASDGYATGLILSGLAPVLGGAALMIGARQRRGHPPGT